jgi:hypothetical protein
MTGPILRIPGLRALLFDFWLSCACETLAPLFTRPRMCSAQRSVVLFGLGIVSAASAFAPAPVATPRLRGTRAYPLAQWLFVFSTPSCACTLTATRYGRAIYHSGSLCDLCSGCRAEQQVCHRRVVCTLATQGPCGSPGARPSHGS